MPLLIHPFIVESLLETLPPDPPRQRLTAPMRSLSRRIGMHIPPSTRTNNATHLRSDYPIRQSFTRLHLQRNEGEDCDDEAGYTSGTGCYSRARRDVKFLPLWDVYALIVM